MILATGCVKPTNYHQVTTPTPTVPITFTIPMQTPTPQATAKLISKEKSFTSNDIAYFEDVALGFEYGDNPPKVFRWLGNPITIRIYGNPDSDSLSCLNVVVSDFNQLSTTTKLQISDNGKGDIDMYFLPDPEFSRIEPNYVQGNWGFFWVDYTRNCEIYHARILISTINPTTPERCHLIREELTQSLGFARDSLRYPDSIFYQKWTETNYYSDIDKDLIKMQYNTEVPLCATKGEVEHFFSSTGTGQ